MIGSEADRVTAPALSNARAVVVCAPALAFSHISSNGAAMSSPIFVAPSKNSTRTTLPSRSAAVTAMRMACPAVCVVLAAGESMATLGASLAGVAG